MGTLLVGVCICRGFRLPVSHVVHTVGPIYHSNSDPAASLASAYRLLNDLLVMLLSYWSFFFESE